MILPAPASVDVSLGCALLVGCVRSRRTQVAAKPLPNLTQDASSSHALAATSHDKLREVDVLGQVLIRSCFDLNPFHRCGRHYPHFRTHHHPGASVNWDCSHCVLVHGRPSPFSSHSSPPTPATSNVGIIEFLLDPCPSLKMERFIRGAGDL